MRIVELKNICRSTVRFHCCVRGISRSGIGDRERVTRGLRPRHEHEAERRVGQIEDAGLGRERLDQRVRRVGAQARTGLREDRLEDASVVEAEAAADREIPRVPPASLPSSPAAPVRRIGKAQTRLDVVGVVAEAVVEPVLLFLRRADVLVADAEVQRQVLSESASCPRRTGCIR